MNLLPKSHEEFSQKEYWDSFFKKRGSKAFEWYGEYPELAGNLHKYIRQQDDILVVGCGNSTLGRDFYDVGFKKVTNIDISQVVIRQMLSQNEKDRPTLKYLQMDALNMSFQDESFSVVLDKGTLDALMPTDDTETVDKILRYFNEIQRVMKTGGRYICISLLQEHILKAILEYFPFNNWMFRTVRCFEAEQKAIENDENSMPVFLVICTKFKALPMMILELNLSSSDKMQRFETTQEIVSQIASTQRAAFICSGLKRTAVTEENEVTLDLYKPGEDKPRFTLYVVDTVPQAKNSKYAAFIVPEGRESEWLFSTKLGRQKLIKMTKNNRLAIVTLHRNQYYGSLDDVQKELTDAIRNLAPSTISNKKIQFLSVGSDVGSRTIRLEGNSKFSGDYVVEDVEVDQNRFRRLFYLSSQQVTQSEAKLKTIKTKKGTKDIVDLAHLTCNHHIYMSVATHLACREFSEPSIVVIGLGGGGLCSFLRKFLPKIKIKGVEIDSDMFKVATDWFGLVPDSNLEVVIKDGLEYLQECVQKNEKFNAILFDVDSKDSTVGLSCPPQQFLESPVLNNISKIINDSGLFILNLVLRDDELRPSILKNLRIKFKTIVSYKLEEDLNEIFICARKKLNSELLKTQLTEACKDINSFFKKNHSNRADNVDIVDYMNKLKIE